MQYPVYLQLSGTENVYAIQGPDRFWECIPLGAQTLCHALIATFTATIPRMRHAVGIASA